MADFAVEPWMHLPFVQFTKWPPRHFSQFWCVHRVVQHVVRADQLVVVCREDDLAIPSGLLAPLHDFQR